jgi:DNA-binding MarR family transcriptional regulator
VAPALYRPETVARSSSSTTPTASDHAGDHPASHRLGHLLWEVSMQANVIGEAHLAAISLTARSQGVLDSIAEAPGSTVSELARIKPVTQQAISQTVARLEKLGYVERRLGSGRGVRLYLTDAGERLRAAGDRLEADTEAELRARLGDELFAQLRACLEGARERLGQPTAVKKDC